MLKKRFTSLLLALTMVLGLSSQAVAMESPSSGPNDKLPYIQDANGDKLEFQMGKNSDGTYTMYYYVI